jgi:hypothetical protein
MSHNVIEIKGDLWSFICENSNLSAYDILADYADFGKTLITKNFGEKQSIELIGVNDIEIAAIQFAESVYYDTHPRPKLVNVKNINRTCS